AGLHRAAVPGRSRQLRRQGAALRSLRSAAYRNARPAIAQADEAADVTGQTGKRNVPARSADCRRDASGRHARDADSSLSLRRNSMSTTKPLVKGFFEKRTFSIQYVVADPDSRKCAIIDPVLDFDEKSGATATDSADAILAYVKEQ